MGTPILQNKYLGSHYLNTPKNDVLVNSKEKNTKFNKGTTKIKINYITVKNKLICALYLHTEHVQIIMVAKLNLNYLNSKHTN